MTYWDEVGRKSIHLGSSIFAVVYWFTDQTFMLRLMIPLTLFGLVVETLRQFSPPVQSFVQRCLGKVMRVEEEKVFTGATYVALGVLLSILLFPKPIAITVMLFLSISDALASLVGIKFGTVRFLGKSLAGSTAFFLSAAGIALWAMPEARVVGLAGAAIATLTEAVSLRWGRLKLDDNLSIPLVSGGAMLALSHSWHA